MLLFRVRICYLVTDADFTPSVYMGSVPRRVEHELVKGEVAEVRSRRIGVELKEIRNHHAEKTG